MFCAQAFLDHSVSSECCRVNKGSLIIVLVVLTEFDT